ncbi:unnamed protein product [Rhodiola kirilowii]
MSQEQPQRPQDEHQHQHSQQDQQQPHEQAEQGKPIKYGDVFPVLGELADQAIAPQDAAMMQTAESMILGQTQKGGTAAVMQAAATYNERAGLVGHEDVTAAAGDQGVTVSDIDVPGGRIVTEQVAGQVVGQYIQPVPVKNPQAAISGGCKGGGRSPPRSSENLLFLVHSDALSVPRPLVRPHVRSLAPTIARSPPRSLAFEQFFF